jgi:branched-chain amino acid transport system permease protein
VKTVILFGMLGLGSGAAYAVLALGVVLVQRGSGTVNFAQGAVGMFAAFFFAELVKDDVSKPLAFITVLVGSAAFGAVWHWLVMRPLRRAPILAKIVCTLGLLIGLQGGAQLWWGTELRNAPAVLPRGVVRVSGIVFGQDRLYLLGITVVIAAVLWAWYKYTIFGIATRAATESERGAALLGYSPDVIAAANWALGCALGAMAGIFIAPIVGLDNIGLTLLILPGLAAGLLGKFHSFSITAAAGILIGVVQSIIGRYWSLPGATDALPFVLVILTMVVTGRLIPARGTMSLARLPLAPGGRLRWYTWVALIGVPILASFMLSDVYKSALTTSVITISAALSVVVVTGLVGQTSLMPMTFAGLGGLLTSKFAQNWGLPFPIPVIFAVLSMVPIGLILGLPALRVRGLNLAVVTIGAAIAVSSAVFRNPNWTGGLQGSLVPSPSLFGQSLDATLHPVSFAITAIAVTAGLLWAVINLRQSPLGLRMLAVRSNERAAAMSGVSVSSIKLQAFALSAAMAALSGSLLAYQIGAVSYDRYDVFGSITLIILVYIGGISVITGAVFAGIAANGGVLYVFLQDRISMLGQYYALVSAVLLVLTVIANPDGAIVANRRQFEYLKERVLGSRKADIDDGVGDGPALAAISHAQQ